MAKLGKPPVVEVWLAIDIEPDPDGLQWGDTIAEEFMRKYRSEFNQFELLHAHQVEVEKRENGLPHLVKEKIELDRVKAFDSARTRCIQISQSRLAYNSLRSGSDYPGYQNVYAEAEEKFKHYLKLFRPLSIRAVSLCYVDIVNVPVSENATVDLADYFVIGRDLPEDPFGQTTQFTAQATLNCPVDHGPAMFTLRSLPAKPGDTYFRFWIEWQKICAKVDSLDMTVVKERLQKSKDYISECFQKSFTNTGWKLFEPITTVE